MITERKILKMVYMFFADGFEELEAVAPVDVLRRAGAKLVTVSIGKDKAVTGRNGITLVCDATIDEIGEDGDMLILPGGMPGVTNLASCEKLVNMLKKAYADGKYIGAICAAPSILGELGMVKGRCAAVYPGMEDTLKGASKVETGVCVDGNVITATAAGFATQFGLALASALCGEDKAKSVADGIVFR